MLLLSFYWHSTVVICLDKREFRHLVGSGSAGLSSLGNESMLGTIELITGKYKGSFVSNKM